MTGRSVQLRIDPIGVFGLHDFAEQSLKLTRLQQWEVEFDAVFMVRLKRKGIGIKADEAWAMGKDGGIGFLELYHFPVQRHADMYAIVGFGDLEKQQQTLGREPRGLEILLGPRYRPGLLPASEEERPRTVQCVDPASVRLDLHLSVNRVPFPGNLVERDQGDALALACCAETESLPGNGLNPIERVGGMSPDHRRRRVRLVAVAVEEDVVVLVDRLRREELGVGAP